MGQRLAIKKSGDDKGMKIILGLEDNVTLETKKLSEGHMDEKE